MARLLRTGLLLGALAVGAAASGATQDPAPAPSRAPTRPADAPPAPSPRTLAAADSIVAAWVLEGRISGAVLVVSSGDRVLLEEAYGWAQRNAYGGGQYGAWRTDDPTGDLAVLERPVPMETGTGFDLASVTKVMATTFAVMLLVDDGALDLDAPAARWLPDFTGGGKERITLRHLLTHRAGLAQWQPVYYHASSPDEAYAYVRDLPLAWRVGEGRHYSDLGFMLLGWIVERAAGAPLDVVLRKRLYAPLGLERTGFRPTGAADAADPVGRADTDAAGALRPTPLAGVFAATSHGNPFEHRMINDSTFGYRVQVDPAAWDEWRRRTLVGEVNDGNAHHALRGVSGHAGLFSTASELRVLLQLLLDRGERAGLRWFGEATVDAFLAPTGDGQALGWQAPAWAPPGSFAHPGFTGTWVLGVPARDLAVVLLTNRQNLGVDATGLYPDVGPLQRAVAEALLSSGVPAPPTP